MIMIIMCLCLYVNGLAFQSGPSQQFFEAPCHLVRPAASKTVSDMAIFQILFAWLAVHRRISNGDGVYEVWFCFN